MNTLNIKINAAQRKQWLLLIICGQAHLPVELPAKALFVKEEIRDDGFGQTCDVWC